MSVMRVVDSPLIWSIAGFAIGVALGVNLLSIWLLAIGLGAYLLYLRLHGPAKESTEGWLFAAGPAWMMSWVLGFIVHSLAF